MKEKRKWKQFPEKGKEAKDKNRSPYTKYSSWTDEETLGGKRGIGVWIRIRK